MRDAGSSVAQSPNSLFDKSVFMQFRSRPSPALFSDKTINLGYTTDRLLQPLSPLKPIQRNYAESTLGTIDANTKLKPSADRYKSLEPKRLKH